MPETRDDARLEHRVQEELRVAAPSGRLACTQALELARRLGVEAKVVGEAADRLGIRIVACQLGCFR